MFRSSLIFNLGFGQPIVRVVQIHKLRFWGLLSTEDKTWSFSTNACSFKIISSNIGYTWNETMVQNRDFPGYSLTIETNGSRLHSGLSPSTPHPRFTAEIIYIVIMHVHILKLHRLVIHARPFYAQIFPKRAYNLCTCKKTFIHHAYKPEVRYHRFSLNIRCCILNI